MGYGHGADDDKPWIPEMSKRLWRSSDCAGYDGRHGQGVRSHIHALAGECCVARPDPVTALLAAAAVMAAAFVKGSIGFGFPVLGTPLLSLVLGVKAAVVVLIVPNII